MTKKIRLAVTIAAVVLIIVILAIIRYISASLSRIPENDPHLVGNTAGNLYNTGLFAEVDGKVYFANAYDNYSIYVMNSDQSDIKKIAEGSNSFINVGGDYIYYYSEGAGGQAGLGYVTNGRGIYRTSVDGKKTVSLSRASSDGMMLVGNHIYYTNFKENPSNDNLAIVTLESITTENEDNHVVLSEHIKLGGYDNGSIYYGGVASDHCLYAYNTSTKTAVAVNPDISVYLPIVYMGRVYYLDLNDNYKLKCYSISDGSITTIVNERVDTYNLYGNMIYYQNCDPDAYALKRVNVDTLYVETIADGVYKNISCTSTYTYFESFSSPLPVYMVPTYGGTGVSNFDAAKLAVIKK